MLVLAIITISTALILYTIGVWGEKLSGALKPLWLSFFWLGFVFDTTGTTLMKSLAGGVFLLDLHGITGLLAVLMMLGHAIWASTVLIRRDERTARDFYKISIIVWAIWLVPYFSGVMLGSGMIGK